MQKNENSLFTNLTGVQINKFSGKHPAGNVGTQIHHIDPINKGEFVWTINVQDLQLSEIILILEDLMHAEQLRYVAQKLTQLNITMYSLVQI
jgi:Na+-transporting NADH:ubiquinone oxidoreductase, subunit NqrA